MVEPVPGLAFTLNHIERAFNSRLCHRVYQSDLERLVLQLEVYVGGMPVGAAKDDAGSFQPPPGAQTGKTVACCSQPTKEQIYRKNSLQEVMGYRLKVPIWTVCVRGLVL